MPIEVVNGAQLLCPSGAAPAALIVTSQQQMTSGGQLAATVMDFAPTVNIPPFGNCKVLTAAASGVPTPCVPATTAPWAPGSTTVKIGGCAALLNTDTLTCTVGGVIAITSPGQTTTSMT